MVNRHFLLLLSLLAVLFWSSVQAQTNSPELKSGHPTHYIVQKGDTLWDIAGQFFDQPADWPLIWSHNSQIQNPNLIYPGDEIRLVMVDGQPQLVHMSDSQGYSKGDGPGHSVKLSPQIRVESLFKPNYEIPLEAIRPYLLGAQVVSEDELSKAPFVLAIDFGHRYAGVSDTFFAKDLNTSFNHYAIFREGSPLVNPDNDEVLGYRVRDVGEADMVVAGDPATMVITRMTRETTIGDKLVMHDEIFASDFMPVPASVAVEGSIVAILDGEELAGKYDVVAISGGAREGLQVGDLLGIYHQGEAVELKKGWFSTKKVELPELLAGEMMVFRTFEKVSYALILDSNRPVMLFDKVSNL